VSVLRAKTTVKHLGKLDKLHKQIRNPGAFSPQLSGFFAPPVCTPFSIVVAFAFAAGAWFG